MHNDHMSLNLESHIKASKKVHESTQAFVDAFNAPLKQRGALLLDAVKQLAKGLLAHSVASSGVKPIEDFVADTIQPGRDVLRVVSRAFTALKPQDLKQQKPTLRKPDVSLPAQSDTLIPFAV